MENPKNIFMFAPQFNTPDHDDPSKMSHDATGAFQLGMEKFGKKYAKNGGNIQSLIFNNHIQGKVLGDRIIDALWMGPNQLDAVCYFGHGWPGGLASAHIRDNNIDRFAEAIKGNSNPGVKVILYACSSGRRNHPGGCFAAKLADRLRTINATVFGHDIKGHSYRNPTLYSYPSGTPVCPPGMEKAFSHAMHDHGSDLWMRFPFMSQRELQAELAGVGMKHAA